MPTNQGTPTIHCGAIFWVSPDATRGSVPGIAHPHVVLQDDAADSSPVHTVLACALTSNLLRASEPGNVLLDLGEGNLTRRSVAVVSQIVVVDKTRLGAYIGTLAPARVGQIMAGQRLQQRSFFGRR